MDCIHLLASQPERSRPLLLESPPQTGLRRPFENFRDPIQNLTPVIGSEARKSGLGSTVLPRQHLGHPYGLPEPRWPGNHLSGVVTSKVYPLSERGNFPPI
jgi:hypothetical protein